MTLADLSTATLAWIAHADHGDTYRLRAKLFRQLPIRQKRQARRFCIRRVHQRSVGAS
jgi:hypothetical protein